MYNQLKAIFFLIRNRIRTFEGDILLKSWGLWQWPDITVINHIPDLILTKPTFSWQLSKYRNNIFSIEMIMQYNLSGYWDKQMYISTSISLCPSKYCKIIMLARVTSDNIEYLLFTLITCKPGRISQCKLVSNWEQFTLTFWRDNWEMVGGKTWHRPRPACCP